MVTSESRALVLAFAVVAGINLAGYKVDSTDINSGLARENVNIRAKTDQLFGADGVEAGARFLRKYSAASEIEPDPWDIAGFRQNADKVEDGIQNMLNSIRLLRASAKKKDTATMYWSLDDAIVSCYSVTFLAAKAMLVDDDILQLYLEAREKEETNISTREGIIAVACLTNAAFACEAVAAPWSFSAVGTWFTTLSWPTIVTVANPAAAAVSVIGGVFLAASMFQNSRRRQEIIRHVNASVLISQCCNTINEVSICLMCIYYLDYHRKQDAAFQYFKSANEGSLLDHWKVFWEKNNEGREQRRRERGNTSTTSTKTKEQETDQTREQQRVTRYIRKFTKEKGKNILNCLNQLRETGRVDKSVSFDSSEDECDDMFEYYD